MSLFLSGNISWTSLWVPGLTLRFKTHRLRVMFTLAGQWKVQVQVYIRGMVFKHCNMSGCA